MLCALDWKCLLAANLFPSKIVWKENGQKLLFVQEAEAEMAEVDQLKF